MNNKLQPEEKITAILFIIVLILFFAGIFHELYKLL